MTERRWGGDTLPPVHPSRQHDAWGEGRAVPPPHASRAPGGDGRGGGGYDSRDRDRGRDRDDRGWDGNRDRRGGGDPMRYDDAHPSRRGYRNDRDRDRGCDHDARTRPRDDYGGPSPPPPPLPPGAPLNARATRGHRDDYRAAGGGSGGGNRYNDSRADLNSGYEGNGDRNYDSWGRSGRAPRGVATRDGYAQDGYARGRFEGDRERVRDRDRDDRRDARPPRRSLERRDERDRAGRGGDDWNRERGRDRDRDRERRSRSRSPPRRGALPPTMFSEAAEARPHDPQDDVPLEGDRLLCYLRRRYRRGGADASLWQDTRRGVIVVVYGFAADTRVTAEALRQAVAALGCEGPTAVCIARTTTGLPKGYALMAFRNGDVSYEVLHMSKGTLRVALPKVAVEGGAQPADDAGSGNDDAIEQMIEAALKEENKKEKVNNNEVPLVMEFGKIENWPHGLQEVASPDLVIKGLDGKTTASALTDALAAAAGGVSPTECIVDVRGDDGDGSPDGRGTLNDYGHASFADAADARRVKENYPSIVVNGAVVSVRYCPRVDLTQPFATRVAGYTAGERARAAAAAQKKKEEADPFGAAFAFLDAMEAVKGKEEKSPPVAAGGGNAPAADASAAATPAPAAPAAVVEEEIVVAAAPKPAPQAASTATADDSVAAMLAAARKRVLEAVTAAPAKPAPKKAPPSRTALPADLQAKIDAQKQLLAKPPSAAPAQDAVASSIQAKLDAQRSLLQQRKRAGAGEAAAGSSRFADVAGAGASGAPAVRRLAGFPGRPQGGGTSSRFGSSGAADAIMAAGAPQRFGASPEPLQRTGGSGFTDAPPPAAASGGVGSSGFSDAPASAPAPTVTRSGFTDAPTPFTTTTRVLDDPPRAAPAASRFGDAPPPQPPVEPPADNAFAGFTGFGSAPTRSRFSDS